MELHRQTVVDVETKFHGVCNSAIIRLNFVRAQYRRFGATLLARDVRSGLRTLGAAEVEPIRNPGVEWEIGYDKN
jgi:hypothetical protein